MWVREVAKAALDLCFVDETVGCECLDAETVIEEVVGFARGALVLSTEDCAVGNVDVDWKALVLVEVVVHLALQTDVF